MQRPCIAPTTVGLAVLSCPMAMLQAAELAIPDGWVASPANDKAEGDAGYRILHDATGIELVWVPGGAFMMGSEQGQNDELPVHEVELGGFWIGLTEVTVAQWRAVMGDVPAPEVNNMGDDHPVVIVSWEDCQVFSAQLGLRLPTEAEWEYAAAGPEARVFPWGNEWDGSRLQWNPEGDPNRRTAPVGSFAQGASWCGALDMAGNVWEWCEDCYDEAYYAASPREDPTGPAEAGLSLGQPDGSKHWWGVRRVIRGGCFNNELSPYFRCAMRNNDPSLCHFALGLRVARSP